MPGTKLPSGTDIVLRRPLVAAARALRIVVEEGIEAADDVELEALFAELRQTVDAIGSELVRRAARGTDG